MYEIISLNQDNIDLYIQQLMQIEQQCFVTPWTANMYLTEIKTNPLTHYWGIVDSGNLVAYGGYWLAVDEGDITNIAVNPDFRRQGLGRMLVQALIDDCQSLGGHSLTLEVRISNEPAISLYRAQGFEQVGRRPGYYQDNGEDCLIMKWTLN